MVDAINSPLFRKNLINYNKNLKVSDLKAADLSNAQMSHLCAPPAPIDICKVDVSGYSIDNFKTVNIEGYSILCHIGEPFEGVKYFPNTSKIVLSAGGKSYPLFNLERYVPCVAQDLGISSDEVIQRTANFLSGKEIIIQPVGLQGTVYNAMRSAQNYIPVVSTTNALSIIKTTGMTGIKIVTEAPLTTISALYMGSMVCAYFGSVAGNNPVGVVLNGSAWILSRPMRGVEVVLNGLILQPISNVIGLPLILNGTQEILNGQGMKIEDYAKISIAFERISNSTLIKRIRETAKIWFNKN